jgi:hypothetical protein
MQQQNKNAFGGQKHENKFHDGYRSCFFLLRSTKTVRLATCTNFCINVYLSSVYTPLHFPKAHTKHNPVLREE